MFRSFLNLEKSPLRKPGKGGACLWSEPKATHFLRPSISFQADGREARRVTTPPRSPGRERRNEGDRERNAHSLAREGLRARARARGLPAPALGSESFLEPLSTQPSPADFRPAARHRPGPAKAGESGTRQSHRACGRSRWGLSDSKGAPPPQS